MSRIILFVLVFTSGLFSLTLQHAVKSGLKNDPRIRVLIHEYNIALQDVGIAEGNYYPTVDISSFAGREYTKTPANRGDSKTLTSRSVSLSAKLNLFAGYKDKYQIEEKKALARLAENRLKEGIISVSQEISIAYIEVLKRYKIYQKYKQNLNNYRRTLKKVATKVKDGGGRDSDLFQSESRMNYEESNLFSAKQAFEDARLVLGKYLRSHPSIKSMREPKIRKKYLNLKRLIAKGKRNNTSIKSIRVQQDVASTLIGQEKSKLYPTIDFQVSGDWRKNQHGILGTDESYSAGINMKYNVFNGGKDSLSIEKSRVERLKIGDSLINQTREVVYGIKRSYNNYKLYNKKLRAINKHIKNAKKTEALYIKEEEETGERSVIDILNIQQEYNSAEVARIDTRYTALQIYFQLLAYSSDILNYFKISR